MATLIRAATVIRAATIPEWVAQAIDMEAKAKDCSAASVQKEWLEASASALYPKIYEAAMKAAAKDISRLKAATKERAKRVGQHLVKKQGK